MATDEPLDLTAAGGPAAAGEPVAADDGGDVAGRDPDAIAREIEQTRAELADTIDAIADRISPRRAASRGAQAVKAQVSSAKDKVTGSDAGGPGSGDDNGSSAPVAPSPARAFSEAASSGPRPEVLAAAAAALALLVWLIRRRRSR
jgi:MYXO-CTERM domain-containing protein